MTETGCEGEVDVTPMDAWAQKHKIPQTIIAQLKKEDISLDDLCEYSSVDLQFSFHFGLNLTGKVYFFNTFWQTQKNPILSIFDEKSDF